MKNNSKKNKLHLVIIILIVVIFTLIGVIIKISNTNNKIEQQKEEQGQQLTETTSSNAYVSMSTHTSELAAKQQELDNLQNALGQATATASQILKDYTAYKNGQLITGTMANNGAVSATLNAGGSYTIPAGYHNGSGKITANSLANQTSATATASDILSGKTAWVNGKKITGTVVNSTNIKFLVVGSGSQATNKFTSGTDSSTLTCNISSKLAEYGIDMSKITADNLILKVTTIGTHNCYYNSNKTVTISPTILAFDNTTGNVTISEWYKKVGDDGYGRRDSLYVGAYEILLPYIV